jgi:hypothetical protein
LLRAARAGRNFPPPVQLIRRLPAKKETKMETGYFLAILSLFTFVAVIVFALISKKKTEERLADPEAHRDENKSTLAKDAPDH